MNLLALKLNLRFERILWFNYIFPNYRMLLFYKLKGPIMSDFYGELKSLRLEGYSFKQFHSGLNPFPKQSYHLLKTKFLIIFSNDFSIFEKTFKHIIPFSICLNGFFLNPFYTVGIQSIYKFYNKNYISIVYLSLFTLISLYRIIMISVHALVHAPHRLIKKFHNGCGLKATKINRM